MSELTARSHWSLAPFAGRRNNSLRRGLALVCLAGGLVSIGASSSAFADAGGSPEGADSNESGGSGCAPCGDTVDSGEKDVESKDKDCGKPAGGADGSPNEDLIGGDDGPHPVAWDTGEKWESVVDLVVRVQGEDFELIRNYTSDPEMNSNIYNSPFVPSNYSASYELEAGQSFEGRFNPSVVMPDKSPSVGQGWAFANLRAVTIAQDWDCIEDDDCNSPGGGYIGAYLGGRVWLHRPGRKPRTFDLFEPIVDVSSNNDIVQSPLSGQSPGNQSVAILEATTEPILPGFGNITCGTACFGQNPIIQPRRVDEGLLRLHEPGQWKQDYRIFDNTGFIERHEDAFGNFHYYYDDADTDKYPNVVYLNGTTDTAGSEQAEAWVKLYWERTATSSPFLVRAEVYRPDGGSSVMTQYVEYYHLFNSGSGLQLKRHNGTSYVTVSGTPHNDTGRNGDLVQVVSYEAIDSAASDYRPTITQYRYHRDGYTAGTGDVRLEVAGKNHQLKMVFPPQQVEFVAQLINADSPPSQLLSTSVVDAATSLIFKADDDPIFSNASVDVMDAAEKIISYDTDQPKVETAEGELKTVASPVDYQIIQASDCGCGGTGAITAKYRTFTQVDAWSATPPGASTSYDGQSMIMEEFEITDFTAALPTGTPYRIYSQDMLMLGENNTKPHVWLKATIDPAADMKWVSENLYNYDKRTLVGRYFPSTFTDYDPATTSPSLTAPIPVRVADGEGYMVEYGYETDNENTSTVSVGPKGGTQAVSLTTHRSDKSYYKHHAATHVGYRVPGSTDEAERETTTISQDFAAANPFAMIWRHTARERELLAENGPSDTGTVESWEFFDTKGNLTWTIDEGGTVTRYEYDGPTGELIRISENVDPSTATTTNDPELRLPDTGSPFTGLSFDSAAGTLVTEYEVDLLGRVVKTTMPGDVESWIVRELREDTERPGILYYATVTLPHKIATGSFDGPAWVRYWDAAGDLIRTESMPIDESVTSYDPDGGNWVLASGDDEILSRVVIAHDLSGAITAQREWWDYGSTSPEKARYYETEYEYDSYGRLVSVTDPTGTIMLYTHDVLDRVTNVFQNTVGSGVSDQYIASYYYDRDPSALPVGQGVGNGNLTRIATYTWDENSDGQPGASGVRTTLRYFDLRNRLIGVMPVDNGPIQLIKYDNLDRPIEMASYPNDGGGYPSLSSIRSIAGGSSLPATAAINDGGGNATRSSYTKISYSQRGLRYRVETAIDPAASSPTFLASNFWYDKDANETGSWLPNAPGVVTAYDAHDRPTLVSLTDRTGDSAALDNSFRHGQATGVSGDHVIEETAYTYDGDSGAVELVTHRRRLHDSTGTGALSSSTAITSYMGFLYDSAWRPTAAIDFGTNQANYQTGSSAPSLTSYTGLSALLLDDDILFTYRTYNERGLVRDVIGTQDGSDEISTRYAYDHLNRPIAVIENATSVDESDITWSTDRYAVAGQDVDYLDRDRVTSFAYDGVGNVTARVAHIPESNGMGGSQESVQETRYVYGVTAGADIDTNPMHSAIHSNRLLSSVNYPDEVTGLADGTGTNSSYDHLRVSYAYNALGEVKGITDQNGTIRWIHRDQLSHVTQDIVHTVGSGVDGTVRRMTYTYDQLGRLTSAASHTSSNIATTAYRDEVEFTYTPLWQIETVAQQHNGEVTGTSPTVAYNYANAVPSTSTGNYSRLEKIIYPADFTGATDSNGFTDDTVGYDYASGIDDRISRPSGLQVYGLIDTAAMADLITYERIGMGVTARAILPHAGDVVTGESFTWKTVLDRTKDIDGSDPSNKYPAFDRFGRVVKHMWVRDDFAPHGSVSGLSNQPPILALGVADHTTTDMYDRMSNKLLSNDLRPGAKLPFRDRAFTYDQLNRLVDEARSPTPTSTYVEQHLAENWELDMLGNWNQRLRDVEKDGDASNATGNGSTQIRAHNQANEIEDPSGSAQYDMVLQNSSGSNVSRYFRFEYDDNGNMASQRASAALPIGGAPMPGLVMTYDAWNRLIVTEHKPSSGSNIGVSAYTYNALGWRTRKAFDTSTGGYDGHDQARVFLYDAGWRMVEERIDTDLDDDDDWISQQFWGLRYIDDAVAKRINRDLTDEDGWISNPGVSVWYQLTDSQFSVSVVLNETGGLYERIDYNAYGAANHRYDGDADGDGRYNPFTDNSLWTSGQYIQDTGYHADVDMNFDGIIDSLDGAVMTANGVGHNSTALPDGWIGDVRSSAAGPDNSIGYCGYVHNAERQDYTVRFRVYDPAIGRWRSRDPISYIGGGNLYGYVMDNPIRHADPLGLGPMQPQKGDDSQATSKESEKCRRIKNRIQRELKNLQNRLAMQAYYNAALGNSVDDLIAINTQLLANKTAEEVISQAIGIVAGEMGGIAFSLGKDVVAICEATESGDYLNVAGALAGASGTCLLGAAALSGYYSATTLVVLTGAVGGLVIVSAIIADQWARKHVAEAPKKYLEERLKRANEGIKNQIDRIQKLNEEYKKNGCGCGEGS